MTDKLDATDDQNLMDATESVEEAPEEPTVDVPQDAPLTPRSVLVKDAKSRSLRTGFQTSLGAAIAAVLMVCATFLQDGDLAHIDWKALAVAGATAGLPPIVAFLQRMLEG